MSLRPLAVLFAIGLAPAALAASISFVEVPDSLPRGTATGPYSPLVAIHYEGLETQSYTIKVHLLETANYFCATDSVQPMWCGATFSIDNQSGNNTSGTIYDARVTNVHDYPAFLWVADLHNQAGTKVATAQQNATSTTNRAPVLGPIGNRNVAAGQSLDFTVASTDAENDARALSARNLPAGATFDVNSGAFHWQPASATTVTVGFVVAQSAAPQLSDAELVTITVGNPPPAGVISFAASTGITGESGPAALTVSRNNGSFGNVSVTWTASNGTATAGSDYTGPTGSITFATGETTRTIRIQTIDDAAIESNETFTVALSSPTGGATLGTTSTATVTIADDDDPAVAGQWGNVMPWPVVPIHMHLLPTGKVMFWDRGMPGMSGEYDGTPRLWDPGSPGSVTTLPAIAGWDLFCSGHSFLADGRLFVAGGHIDDQVGDGKAAVYDPIANQWTAIPAMNEGRWYPTATTLANGDVLVVAGEHDGYGDINLLPQVWQASTGTWRDLTGALLGGLPAWPNYYPFLYAAPNGKVFMAGPQQTSRYLDTSVAGAWTDVASSAIFYRDYGSSVMYDTGKVLIAGGNPRDADPQIAVHHPSAVTEVIDLGQPTPAWSATGPMSVGRRHLNTTLLPDGTVLATGGSSMPGFDEAAGAVRYAELWSPATGTWTPLASHARYRGYHSNALLLPDARVLVAGGGHPDPPPPGSAEPNAEIFSPPYLFRGPRPAIVSAPASVTYGQTFFVETPDAANITAVTWVRPSSVTHAFNQNQRINRLAFVAVANGLNVTAPATAHLCPPGDSMLFLLNGNGVPSVAKFVRIGESPLRIDNVAPLAGRASGGQQIVLTGAFAGLAGVTVGGVAAAWTFSSGTSQVAVTTPAHAPGAVAIDATPFWGSTVTRPNTFAFLRTTFTDDPIVARSTRVKAVHIRELRESVDALRAVTGLPAVSWTDPVLPSGTRIRAVHLTELRTFLEQAAAVLGLAPASYTDPSLSGVIVKRIHVEELRQRLRTIAG